MRNWNLCVILIATLCICSADLSIAAASDIYQGRIVDEQTGAPLGGTVITVVWFRSPLVYMDRRREFQSAQEAIADTNGNFSLLVAPGIDWNPFTYVLDRPDIVIFHPGYEPTWAGWIVRMGFTEETFPEALKLGLTIKLRKLTTKEELRRYSSVGSLLSPVVPHHAVINLLRAINIQSIMAGLQPYPEPEGNKR